MQVLACAGIDVRYEIVMIEVWREVGIRCRLGSHFNTGLTMNARRWVIALGSAFHLSDEKGNLCQHPLSADGTFTDDCDEDSCEVYADTIDTDKHLQVVRVKLNARFERE